MRPSSFSRSAHRRSVRAACGSAAGALAGRLRRRRAPRCSSHAVARRARASLQARRWPSRLARVAPARELVPFVAAGERAQTGGSEERLAAARAQRRAAPGAGRVRNPTTVRGCFYAEATNRQHGFVNATPSGEI